MRNLFHAFSILLWASPLGGAIGSDLSKAIDRSVDGSLVVERLQKLATFSDAEAPAVTRVLFSENDLKARKDIKELMTDAGLKIREDSMGNIFGRWDGSRPQNPAIVTGSHTDAIPLSGMYDGTVGVIGAIHAIECLKSAGFNPNHPIEVLMFTSEEPTRFQLGCIGSRGMSGALSKDILDSKLDVGHATFGSVAKSAGYEFDGHLEILEKVRVSKGEIAHFVELHIEQGPLLEKDKVDIGVVSAIAAPATLRVNFWGDGGHAGALLMPHRNDAGLAASELALEVERNVLATGVIDTVGTAGLMNIDPNAVNSVPRHALLEIDIRDIEESRRDEVVKGVLNSVEEIAKRRKVRHLVEIVNQDPPATCNKEIIGAIKKASNELGLSSMDMVSRAYHDSLFMARIAPTGMIFIPCRDGISHRPDEFASPKDIANGVKVLALTLAELAGGEIESDDKQEL